MKEPLNAECRLEFGTILKIGLHCRFFTASFTDITFTKDDLADLVRSLVVSNLRSETKGSQFEFQC